MSKLLSLTKTICVPSGDQFGLESTAEDVVIRFATNDFKSISHNHPFAANTIDSPDGEGAGSVGPAFKMGSS
ncbi:hypothetical protein GCM10022257_02780 [Hyunsoonleella aestuarii]|uniref:Uncharacterized protein n=1 Tax=Hyunsoonleella aestuarii TaxID=912802 RepID=A0ABP8E7F2_9FLAO